MSRILDQLTLDDKSFWKGKGAELPKYDRKALPVKALCFSAGRMAYGHTGDILQDLLNQGDADGTMVGIETFAHRYVAELAASDYLMTQLIYENEKGKVVPKVQGAIANVLFVDADAKSLTFRKMLQYARDPKLQFATINAPEMVYGVVYKGGEFAEPVNKNLIKDIEEGTFTTDPAKWTAFALERFNAGLKFALVSCTNFSGNGHYTGGTVRAVARGWEERGFAPKGFTAYLADPSRFSFPNCMIDRIAVPPDAKTQEVMDKLGVLSNIVVTERTRYWAVEDAFPAGRPALENAVGVFMEDSYEQVKKYEDMKLRILNMAHSTIAGLGILLGYRGPYAIYRAMQDPDLRAVIERIINIVVDTVEWPRKMSPKDFARDTYIRLDNPNIPDDPMRIAFNASAKMLPRFMDTYFVGREKGMSEDALEIVLLPVAGFLRYTLALDDAGEAYNLENDPIKDKLMEVGQKAKLGDTASVAALAELIARADVMGKDLYAYGGTGKRLEALTAKMLAGTGAVRKTVKAALAK